MTGRMAMQATMATVANAFKPYLAKLRVRAITPELARLDDCSPLLIPIAVHGVANKQNMPALPYSGGPASPPTADARSPTADPPRKWHCVRIAEHSLLPHGRQRPTRGHQQPTLFVRMFVGSLPRFSPSLPAPSAILAALPNRHPRYHTHAGPHPACARGLVRQHLSRPLSLCSLCWHRL